MGATVVVMLVWLALTVFARPVAARLQEWVDAATFAIGADVLPGPKR